MDRSRRWRTTRHALGVHEWTRPTKAIRWPVGRLHAILISLLMLMAGAVVAVTTTGSANAALPTGFEEQIVLSGLTNPTVVRFAGDGRVFVAEKRGVIKVFDSLSDTTPTVFADLNVNVHNFWDRGLLGMALDPQFPTNPYVYVLYTYDRPRAAMGHARRLFGPMPDASRCHRRRLRRRRSPVAPAGERKCDDRFRAGPGRGLVPAISQPLRRHGGIRSRWCSVCQRR